MGKIIDLGFLPPNHPLFKRGWIIGGRRLTDVVQESEQRGKGAMPMCAQPEDYGIEIEAGETFCPIENGCVDEEVEG